MRSHLVALVAVAALFVWIAPATAATPKLESLSVAQRESLPDTAVVTVGKTGRTVPIGTLRAESKLRAQQFANASNLGKAFAASRRTAITVKGKLTAPVATTGSVWKGTLVPMVLSQQNFTGASTQNFVGTLALPADFVAFCKAALATGCLYLPAGQLTLQGGAAVNSTMILTQADQQQCSANGGVPELTGIYCNYSYPLGYTLTFTPNSPVTYATNCPAPFTDPALVGSPTGSKAITLLMSYNTSQANTTSPSTTTTTTITGTGLPPCPTAPPAGASPAPGFNIPNLAPCSNSTFPPGGVTVTIPNGGNSLPGALQGPTLTLSAPQSCVVSAYQVP